jgi:choline dehydrogenase-like flavoprotein
MSKIDFNDGRAVVIVGSGAGGGTLANELCQRGVDVIVLEAGKHYTINDFVNDEATMFGRITWLDKRTMSGDASWVTNRAAPTWTCKTVGGTTVHWAGCCPRFKEHELRIRTVYGDIAGADLIDWPITLQELAPYYDKAESKMGITGTHGIPLLPGNNNFKVLQAGAGKLGYKQVSTGHMAINSQARDGRPGCQQLGFCFQGCKTGAKWSTLYAELPKAQATGKLDLRPECMALQVQHDASGKVTGVLYADPSGKQQLQKARAVCVAGNAVETPRLLLNSASSKFPDGLANSNGAVGKYYTVHATGAVFAVFDKPVHMHRGTTMAGIVEDESRNDPSRGFVGGYYMEQIAVGAMAFAVTTVPDAWGEEYGQLMDAYDRVAGIWLCGEDMPLARNRITLNTSEKDQYGLPIPHVHIDRHANDLALVEHSRKQATALYEAAGATKVIQTPAYPAGHNMGSCRMSTKPADGVVNRWGQAHEVKNLFVSDGSVFTTSAAANPTLTITALAIRQAEYIAGQMARGQL